MAPGGAVAALRNARNALDILAGDCRLSGLRERQRTLTKAVRDAVETLDWLIDFEHGAALTPYRPNAGRLRHE